MKNRYGIQWSDELTDVDIELACYLLKWPREKGGLGASGHIKNAIRLLFPPPLYIWHHWSDKRFDCLCNNFSPKGHEDYYTWWGPSSTAKSTDAAIFFLVDWYAAPHITRTAVCSTTRPMLDQRIFGEIIKFHQSRPGLPGEYFSSEQAILWDKTKNPKAGIFGIAILAAKTTQEALGNVIGAHQPRNRLVLDEMQGMKEAAEEAIVNLSGSGEFKFLGMGNPVSKFDLLGKNSEPLNGWGSVNADMSDAQGFLHWTTRKGVTCFFDGRKSPGVFEPEKYHFLLTKAKIDRTKKDYGDESIQYFSQRVGWVAPEGMSNAILSERDIVRFKAREPTKWAGPFKTICGFDPAYSSQGDRAILQFVDVGPSVEGDTRLSFHEPIHVKISAVSDQPMSHQLCHQVMAICMQKGVGPYDMAMDVTGLQRGFADLFEQLWGVGIYRVSFGEAATTLPVTYMDHTPANKVYSNRVTELWMTFAEFVRHGNVRSLSMQACIEFSSRYLERLYKPMVIEEKRKMKERTKMSPDIADACAIATAYVRERMGIYPGKTDIVASGREETVTENWREGYSTQEIEEEGYKYA